MPNGYNPGPECLRHTPAAEVSGRDHSAELEREAKRHERLFAGAVRA